MDDISSFIIARIRTGVQLLIGYIITQLLESNFAPVGDMIQENRTIFEGLLILIFTLLWRETIELIAKKYPVAGWLNGFPALPQYTRLPKNQI